MEYEVKIPNVRMHFNQVLTSAAIEGETKSGIVHNTMLNYQVVVAAGKNSSVQPGDIIEINPSGFRKERIGAKYGIGDDQFRIISPVEEIDGIQYLYISDRDVKWVYNDGGSLNHTFDLK